MPTSSRLSSTRARFGQVRARRGMTLIEIMVALGIMMLITAVLLPSLDGLLMLEQVRAARRLTMVYAQLHDEAILRNRTFRIAYHLDENYYVIEAGDPSALIFSDFETREAFEEREEDMVEDMTEEELREYRQANEFKTVDGGGLGGRFEFPANTRFLSVYTPQYEEPVKPTDLDEKARRKAVSDEEDKGPRVIYSYVFSNGFAEFTMVQLVDRDDPEAGFTITVDPMSGKVDLYSDLVDRHDLFRGLPDEGPRLSN
jgi:type II secretory pathway pseudopilin PulG